MTLFVDRRQRTWPMRLNLSSAPAAEPISTAVAKLHLRVDVTDDDVPIASLVVAARRACEKFTGRALITQTWELFLDSWPAGGLAELWEGTRTGPQTLLDGQAAGISLPRPPLQSVTTIKTYDDSDVATTFSSDDYFVDAVSEPGRVVLRSGASWPQADRVANGIEITFVAGYGAAGSDVPDDLLQGMLTLIGHLYENRETAVVGAAVATVPFATQELWAPYRVMEIG